MATEFLARTAELMLRMYTGKVLASSTITTENIFLRRQLKPIEVRES